MPPIILGHIGRKIPISAAPEHHEAVKRKDELNENNWQVSGKTCTPLSFLATIIIFARTRFD